MSTENLSDKDKEMLIDFLRKEVIYSMIIDSIIFTEETYGKECKRNRKS